METSIHRSELRLDCKPGQMMNKSRDPEQIRAKISVYDQFNSLPQQTVSHSRFHWCVLDEERERSTRWAFGRFQVAEFWMEFGFQP